MNENHDGCHDQMTTRTFIYTKSKNIVKRFYLQKAIHLTLRDSHENFEVGIYIQKA